MALVITATLLGAVTPAGRFVERCEDRRSIVVSGAFGGSILEGTSTSSAGQRGLLLNDRYELHAGMDISDGLAIDLSR